MNAATTFASSIAPIESLPHVTGTMSYVIPPAGKPHSYQYEPPPGVPRLSAAYEQHTVVIRNLRPIASKLELDAEGFRLIAHESRARNFFDDAEIRASHYRIAGSTRPA